MQPIDLQFLRDTLLAALREDVGNGDITSRAIIPPAARGAGRYTSKQPLVVAGIGVVKELVSLVDQNLEFRASVQDGAAVTSGTVLAEITGSAHSILIVERTSLNILQRMCGIASLARQFSDLVKGTRARIIDTRKTAPGLRVLDKYAVTCGGGMNHRAGLFDAVLIKNNHLIFQRSIAHAVHTARSHVGHLVKIEVEVRSLEELRMAIEAGSDVVLLDNFDHALTRQAVEIAAGRVPLESSGGITLDNVRGFAEAGVDYISVGALTHSVPAVDINLRVTPK